MTNQEAVPAVALVLRTCDKNMQGYGGFQWPTSGEVSAPDWKSKVVCGNGLHGLLWGNGSSANLSRERDAKWLVCEVDPTTCVDLDGKVKFPRCNVVAVYDNMAEAITRIVFDPRYPHPNTEGIASGTYGTAASRGTSSSASSSGDYSKAASSGISSSAATIGESSTASSSGISSTASSSGNSSTASSSGNSSTASSSGASGIAAACGCETWARAGPLGCIFATEWVAAENRYRGAVGYIGENGVKADTWYRCVAGQLVEAK